MHHALLPASLGHQSLGCLSAQVMSDGAQGEDGHKQLQMGGTPTTAMLSVLLHLRQASWYRIRISPGACIARGFNQYANKDSVAVVWHADTGGRKGRKLSLVFLPRDFNLMGKVSVTLRYFCHTPDTFFPLCFTSEQQP